jgi:hypothetical protein
MSARTTFQADAGARRALDQQLYVLVGRAVREVRVARVTWRSGQRWRAMVVARTGREVPVYAPGMHHLIARLLRDTFPQADWGIAQNYDAVNGILTEHTTQLPDTLAGDPR